MSIRSWSIRAKISMLVVPPVVALVAFWLIGTTLSAASSINLLNAEATEASIVTPGRALVTEIQAERRISAMLLAGQRERAADLTEQRGRTDAAVATFRRHAVDARAGDTTTEHAAQRIGEALRGLDTLATIRTAAEAAPPARVSMMTGYSAVVDAVFSAFWPLTELDDPEATRLSRTAFTVEYGREILAREDALVAAAAAAGRLITADHSLLVQTIGAQRGSLASVAAELPDAYRAGYRQLIESPELGQLRALEERLLVEARAGAALPFGLDQWQAGYRPAADALHRFQDRISGAFADRKDTVATTYYWRLGVTGVAGLIAVTFSVLVAFLVGRALVRRLSGLRGAALEIAYFRLPDVVQRLGRGEDVPSPAATPVLELGGDEIGQVAEAFNDVQRTAVESAVKEATLRRGLNEVFLNIARRSQTLLHRQLTLLDRMERRTTEPEELEDLFRVDHLATRMRRHAEDLVILAGAAPGRGWRQPVPLVDVIRGAASEVEDYARVKILSVPEASLAGRAVADVIHLLAELLENATSYSPPHTRVHVTGELVPNGFAVEIEDRGLGMTQEEMDRANERLRQPPDFDPANSARLGLLVVSLLAARLGVKVTLRSSPYGGVTAVALIPPDLIEEAPALVVGMPAEVVRPSAGAITGQRAIGASPVVDWAAGRRAGTDGPATGGATAAGSPGATADTVMPSATAETVMPSATAETPSPSATAETPSPSATADTESASPAAPGQGPLTPDGLPRRVRRHARPDDDTSALTTELADGQATQPLPPRPPEQTRAMMSAFQAGLARGRQIASAAGTPAPRPAPDQPAPPADGEA